MSLVYFDGFDSYSTHADMRKEGWYIGNDTRLEILLTGGRYGEGRVRIWDDISDPGIGRNVDIDGVTIFLQVAFKLQTNSLVNAKPEYAWIGIYNGNSGTGPVTWLSFTNTGQLQATTSGGGGEEVVGISDPGVIKEDVWQYIELKAVADDTNGKVFVQIDGNEVFDLSGLDTTQVTPEDININHIKLGSGTGSAVYGTSWDDLVVFNDVGLTPLDGFVGDVRISPFPVIGDDTQADWELSTGTNGYELVDDTVPGGDDGDGTFIHTNTANAKSLFTMGLFPGDPDTIFGMGIRTTARKDNAGTINVKASLHSGLVVDSGNLFVLSTDYQSYLDIWGMDPSTNKLWIQSGIESMKIGVETTI